MLLYRLRWLFWFVAPVLLPGAVAYALGRVLPLPWAVLAYLATYAGLALLGCRVVGTTFVQQGNWRTRFADRCLPFAQCMGGGTLPQVFVSSLLGSTAVGGLVFLFVFLQQRDAPPPWPLATAFAIDAVSLLFLAAAQTRTYLRGAPTPRLGRRFYLAVVLQVAIATTLHLAGHPWLATVLAAGPQLLWMLRPVLYVLAVLAAGRNYRGQ